MPSLRHSYPDEPGLVDEVLPLLGAVFTGLAAREEEARKRGLRWEDVSVPFLRIVEGRPVSHVGLIDVPLVIDGVETVVGGIHAVATLSEHRRRGYYREVMTEAVAFGEERYGTLCLSTGEPFLYEPFGFRVVEESRFVTDDPPTPPPGRAKVRRLDPRSDDLAMLRRLLATRQPVSNRLGVVREEPIFLFDTAMEALDVALDLDAVIYATRDEETLRIYDVVATEMPTLAEILARYEPVDRVEVYFAPDRLDADLVPEPHLLFGDDYLMVRGEFAVEGTPFMLPLSGRC